MQPKPEVKPAKPKRTPQPKSDENGEPSNDSDVARRRKSARLSGKVQTLIQTNCITY